MKKTLIFTLALSLITAVGCKKDFYDINDNPNLATGNTVELLLPGVEVQLAYTVGNQYQIIGGIWSQYYTQGPTASQYRDEDRYIFVADDSNRPWNAMYSGNLLDNEKMIGLAKASGKVNYEAIGLILKAYTFQVLTDVYGDVPFSEALKGDEGIISPKYDSQEAVYDGIIALLDTALNKIDAASDVHPTTDDFLFAGDMDAWGAFANSIKLRVYMRESDVRPAVAQAGIAEVLNNPYGLIEDGEVNVNFTTTQFNRNPLFTTIQATSTANLTASAAIIDTMLAYNDGRIDKLFNPASTGGAPTQGTHRGLMQDSAFTIPASPAVPNTNFSTPLIIETTPVVLMSGAEVNFLLAEAEVRGLAPGDGLSHYEAGIDASFAALGADRDSSFDAAAAYPVAGTNEQKLNKIYTQKWVAMANRQNIEAWTEWRRTNVPRFRTAIASTLAPNTFPARLLYPSDESNYNAKFPGQKTLVTKLWWDVRP